MVYSVYAATLLLAQPLAGWLTDRIGRRGIILPGLFITGLATGILSRGGSSVVFAMAGFLFGLGGGFSRGGVDPLVQDSVPHTLRGTAAAVQYTSFDFWIGTATYPVGLLANAVGYAGAFAFTGAICILGGLGVALILRETGEGSRLPGR
jgi:MFS family permease